MADPMKATLFICRAHGANPMALRALLKDPRVAYTELMPTCCSPEGQDQIALHLKAGTTQALVVAGCSPKHLGRYQEIAGAAGVPLTRVAVVPASACKNPAMTDQALSKVLDPRASWSAPKRASERLLIVGDGISADQAIRQAAEEGIEHLIMTSSEVLAEGNRLIGGPNDFILECGEEMHRFGAALLAMDMRIEVHRERLSEAPGTALLLSGGEECLEAFWAEMGQVRGGKTYVIAQETPFPGANELLYADAQGQGTTFLRSAQAEVRSDGVMIHDEHLDEDVLLTVGQVIIVRSSRPTEAASLLRMFGLPKDHRSAEMEPGRSGMPGVYLAGLAYTEFAGPDAAVAARAAVVAIASEMKVPQVTVPLARVDPEKCSLCLTCLRMCPYQAPQVQEDKMFISLLRCQGCGLCVSMCPSQAIEMPPADMRYDIGGESK